MNYEEAEKILQVYDLEEVIQNADMSAEEALCFLVNEDFMELPEILPT